MTIFSRAATAVGAALLALALTAPPASAAGPRGSLTARAERQPTMHWFHWHPTRRSLEARAGRFGSTAVVGLVSMRELPSLRRRYGFEHVRPIPSLRAAQVGVAPDRLHALLVEGADDPRIRYVSPAGRRRHVSSTPDDPLVQTVDPVTGQPYEWQFAASNVARALDLTPGDPGIVVGIIDTGIADVPDLAGKIDGLWSVAPDGKVTPDSLSVGNDDTGHGTAVASLIGANVGDGFGMAGFGGAAHVIAVHAGYHGFFHDAAIALALIKLDALGVRIVNMSLGGPSPSEPILIDAIHKAAADGILLVAAAGNAHGEVSWPAAALQPSGGGRSFGLAVGASDFEGGLADFSNAGKHLSLVAPGAYGDTCSSGLLIALPPESAFEEAYCHPRWAGPGGALYGYAPGTSFAAPEVAGVAALVWAVRPELRNYEVADIIKQSARRGAGTGWTPSMGCGILDAGAAVELATSRTAAEWAAGVTSEVATCSAGGSQPAAWPSEASQTIAFARLRDRAVTAPDFKVRATASSGLPVSFTASGMCTIRAATVHPTGVGSCTITASQPGNADYNPARPVLRTFAITEVPPGRRVRTN